MLSIKLVTGTNANLRESAPYLEFGDHTGFSIITGTVLVDQPLSQHLSVKLLEHVFVLNVFEHHHLGDKHINTETRQ